MKEFKIKDYENDDYFLIEWRVEGKKFRIKRRYNNSNKERKYNEIEIKQKELLEKWKPIIETKKRESLERRKEAKREYDQKYRERKREYDQKYKERKRAEKKLI